MRRRKTRRSRRSSPTGGRVSDREPRGERLHHEITDLRSESLGPVELHPVQVPYTGEQWLLAVDFTYTHDSWGEGYRTFGRTEFISATGDGSDWQSFVPASTRQKPDFRLGRAVARHVVVRRGSRMAFRGMQGSSVCGAILGMVARPLIESLMQLAPALRQDARELLRGWISRRCD